MGKKRVQNLTQYIDELVNDTRQGVDDLGSAEVSQIQTRYTSTTDNAARPKAPEGC
jgi:hypothetical protein